MGGYDFYLLVFLPAMVIAGLASLYTSLTFRKYSRVSSASGCTGAEAARRLLAAQGIYNVDIEEVGGFLSDHYDPGSKKLRLSPDVYNSNSLSAIGVACHEAGHAIQHATQYGPLALRTALVPVAQFGTFAPYIIAMVGLFLNSMAFVEIGAMVFAVVVLFTLVTLPVEWDASRRAKLLMTTGGIVSSSEGAMAGKVLNAAFLTYVAAVFVAVLEFVYFLLRFGLLDRRDD